MVGKQERNYKFNMKNYKTTLHKICFKNQNSQKMGFKHKHLSQTSEFIYYVFIRLLNLPKINHKKNIA